MIGRITPEMVTELSKCEIFVFGSNLAGHHHGGAARLAHNRFGAEWGVGVGRTGQTYAIPTMHGGVEEIKPYIDGFIDYVKTHPGNRFLVTRIGCGIAGFKDSQIAPMFKELRNTPNVCLPIEWMLILDQEEMLDVFITGIEPEKPQVSIPLCITEKDLIRLCDEFRYVIGAGIVSAPQPEILIRYVIGRDRFGFAKFGNIFFTESGDLYVWTRNKEFSDHHDQDMVESIFGDECKDRGYFHRVLFGGVKTPFLDSNGDAIFTGDVVHLFSDEIGEHTFALGTLGENEDNREAQYAFVLDNHCVLPERCKQLERVGTVFYQLDRDNGPKTIFNLCCRFQPCYPDGLTEQDRLVMCRYTPNFDKEVWKYHALNELGVKEFNWRNGSTSLKL